MDYQFFAILLLLLGFVLIVAEVFLPSGGLILALCAIAFGASLWCASKAWYGTHPVAYGVYIASLVVLIPAVVVGAFQLFPRTTWGRNLIGAPTLEEVTPNIEERERLSGYIGRVGRTLTPLTPGGLVIIDSERLHAFSEGILIDRDRPVEIVEVRGMRVLVREARTNLDLALKNDAHDVRSPEAIEPGLEDGLDEPPLDFKVPQG